MPHNKTAPAGPYAKFIETGWELQDGSLHMDSITSAETAEGIHAHPLQDGTFLAVRYDIFLGGRDEPEVTTQWKREVQSPELFLLGAQFRSEYPEKDPEQWLE